MRIALSHKFVLRSLLVAAAVVVFPALLRALGVASAPWAAPFFALGAGGLLGFFLSRELGSKFARLSEATERVRAGELATSVALPATRFPDETDDLADSITAMLASLRELVEQVQRSSVRVAQAAQDLSHSTVETRSGQEEISATVKNRPSSISPGSGAGAASVTRR